MSPLEEARALAMRAAARASVEEVARALDAIAVPWVALKGAALVLDVYPESALRLLTDVDVLVTPRAFDAACAALERAGFRLVGDGPHALSRTFLGRASPLPVDLHGALFSRALFRMPAEALIARAVPVPGLDVPARRLHGLDLVAHAIGHFAKTRPPPDARTLGRDIAFATARDVLGVDTVARHLETVGLRRAAEYALARVDDDVARALHDALVHDPLAAALAKGARALEAAPLETARSVMSRHMLNESLPRAAASFAFHALDAARSRLSRRP